MIRFHALLATVVVATAALVFAEQPDSSAAALFQQGLLLERAEGNVTQAIVLYERVDRRISKRHVGRAAGALAPGADLRQPAATRAQPRMWSRLARDFGDTPYGAEARRRLGQQERRRLDRSAARRSICPKAWRISARRRRMGSRSRSSDEAAVRSNSGSATSTPAAIAATLPSPDG